MKRFLEAQPKPELKALPDRPKLKPDATWECIFQQDIPKESLLQGIIRDITHGYANIVTMFQMSSMESHLNALVNPEIDANNIEYVSFLSGTQPIFVCTDFFRQANPMAARLTDSNQVSRLENPLEKKTY